MITNANSKPSPLQLDRPILICDAPYYPDISKNLYTGARLVLEKSQALYHYVALPGAFEIPAFLHHVFKSPFFAGVVVLGCVIRGETSHYDLICQSTTQAIQEFACKFCVPVGFGLLTVENEAQAQMRSDPNGYNKGGFAAQACLDMCKLLLMDQNYVSI